VRLAKRGIDVVGSALALVILSPLLAAVALAVRVRLGSPVLFRQARPGKDGALFTLLKFRTMSDARDASGSLLPDADRLTPLGRRLREWSLDELPEFVNVLRGDMSLVGPRPLLPEYLGRYNERQARRHAVKPGLTGVAQLDGRNLTSWADRLELDVWYVEHWSLSLDAKLMARTIGAVLRRSGISAEGHATMPKFAEDGTPPSREP
jgi:lipopolysaccharide/colanic/teichoic acid biosynthesis glycosyltransferase